MGRLSAPATLERALASLFSGPDCTASIEWTASRPWASATFTGARHVVRLRLSGSNPDAAANQGLSGIEEREFALPGHILVDIALSSREAEGQSILLTLETLTVEAD